MRFLMMLALAFATATPAAAEPLEFAGFNGRDRVEGRPGVDCSFGLCTVDGLRLEGLRVVSALVYLADDRPGMMVVNIAAADHQRALELLTRLYGVPSRRTDPSGEDARTEWYWEMFGPDEFLALSHHPHMGQIMASWAQEESGDDSLPADPSASDVGLGEPGED